MTGQKTALQQP